MRKILITFGFLPNFSGLILICDLISAKPVIRSRPGEFLAEVGRARWNFQFLFDWGTQPYDSTKLKNFNFTSEYNLKYKLRVLILDLYFSEREKSSWLESSIESVFI